MKPALKAEISRLTPTETFEPGFQRWNPGHFMKKQVAILVDAEWFRKVLASALFPRTPAIGASTSASPRAMITAEQFYRNACKALDPTREELFRFFCYDCEPFDKPQRNPVDLTWIRFGKGHPVYEERMRFYQEIAAMPFVALRRGVVKGRGWEIRESVTNQMLAMAHTPAPLLATDIKYAMEQKEWICASAWTSPP